MGERGVEIGAHNCVIDSRLPIQLATKHTRDYVFYLLFRLLAVSHLQIKLIDGLLNLSMKLCFEFLSLSRVDACRMLKEYLQQIQSNRNNGIRTLFDAFVECKQNGLDS